MTEIEKGKFVGITNITRSGPIEVYDLEVAQDHEFYANGFLVHNCLGNYHPHGDKACLRGSTVVPMLFEEAKTIAELAKTKAGPKSVLAYDEAAGEYVRAVAHSWRETKKVNSLVQVVLSSGERLELTSDHEVLTTKGWVEAGHLKLDDAVIGGTIKFGPDPVLIWAEGDKKISSFLQPYEQSILGRTTANNNIYPAYERNRVVKLCAVALDNPEPVYDFTVDNYANMIVYTSGGRSYGNFSVVHNCYDAIVNAAVNQNIPMVHGEGNFGTMTEGPAAMRYCFTEDSMVLTDTGMKTFKQIAEDSGVYQKSGQSAEFEIVVVGKDGFKTTSHVVCSGEQKTVTVTAGGYKVRCTPNEPFLVRTSIGYVWKDAQLLTSSDWVCMLRGIGYNTKGKTCKKQQATAYVLGYLLGSGEWNFSENSISFSHKEQEAFDDFVSNWSKSHFSSTYTTSSDQDFYGNTLDIDKFLCNNPEAVAVAERFGLVECDEHERKVPEFIWKMTKADISRFLSAVFECLSEVVSEVNANSSIVLQHPSEKLVEEVRLLLLTLFGITSDKISPCKFSISGAENINLFCSDIGMCSQIKNSDIALFSNEDDSYRDCVPCTDEFGLIQESNVIQREKFREAYESGLLKSDAAKVVYERDYFYARVESVETSGTDWVYDVTVPDGHSFNANGFVVHNTNLKLSKYSDSVFFDKFYLPTIEYVPNYDGSRKEPLVLPALLPNAVLNGNFGIAPGVNTRSPMFTLGSVVKVLKTAIENGGNVTAKMCMDLEFTTATGGKAVRTKANRADYLTFFETGKGRVTFTSTHTPPDKTNSIRFDRFAPISDMEKVMTKIEGVKGVQSTRDDSDEKDPFKTAFVITFAKTLKGAALDKAIAEVNGLMTSTYTFDVKVTDRYIRPSGQAGAKLRSSTIPELLQEWLQYRVAIEKKACLHWMDECKKRIKYTQLMRLAISKLSIIIRHVQNKRLDDLALVKAIMKDLKITEEETNQILARNLRQLRHLEDSKLADAIKELEKEVKGYEKRIKKPNDFISQHLTELAKKI